MIALFGCLREALRPSLPARRRSLSVVAVGLDQRALLSGGFSHALAARAAHVVRHNDVEHNGTVVKTPRFYEDYVGPQLAQLDAVKATGTLLRDGSLRFLGVNQGAI